MKKQFMVKCMHTDTTTYRALLVKERILFLPRKVRGNAFKLNVIQGDRRQQECGELTAVDFKNNHNPVLYLK